MKKNILKIIIKNGVVLTGTCGLAVIFLYILGHFISLHPDAYRDLIRSILMGYGIYITGYGLYRVVFTKFITSKRNSSKTFTEADAAATDLSNKEVSKTKNLQRSNKKTMVRMKETPLEAICVTFMVITFLNSVMMLTGIDTPKEGIFAYIHMMTRLLIITGIITVFMWKDVLERVKKFNCQNIFKNISLEAPRSIFRSTAKLFALITAVYCVIMIAFQSIINPSGGAFFYQSLLVILLSMTIAMISIRISRKTRENRGSERADRGTE